MATHKRCGAEVTRVRLTPEKYVCPKHGPIWDRGDLEGKLPPMPKRSVGVVRREVVVCRFVVELNAHEVHTLRALQARLSQNPTCCMKDIYEAYCDKVEASGGTIRSNRTIRNYIDKYQMLHLIEGRAVSWGRYGRKTVYRPLEALYNLKMDTEGGMNNGEQQ